ncbi:Hypothetical predicted protein [Cloeon dipterum]|uniref:ZAD domain-containing protein n=1 Tax=Cloeon dipterum TaxID=197152 RepID=A0A8S1D5D3_9INSE|nr:Hypothetical predicted protein [Cloeon dipterum]
MNNLKLCRFCHQKGQIDLNQDKSGEVLKKINLVVSYKFELRPELSPLLCKECFKDIKTSYAFQMKCLKHEHLLRKRAKIMAPEVKVDSYSTDINETNTASLLSDSGLQVLRQNIKQLNDQIATMKQDKILFVDKIKILEQERDDLKRSLMQYTITLPEITKNISSLLSRMEQQFVNMNTRIIPDNYVETRARSPIVSISVNQKSCDLDDEMVIGDVNEDDDEEELLLKGVTTIWDPSAHHSNFYTVLVPRRPIT